MLGGDNGGVGVGAGGYGPVSGRGQLLFFSFFFFSFFLTELPDEVWNGQLQQRVLDAAGGARHPVEGDVDTDPDVLLEAPVASNR